MIDCDVLDSLNEDIRNVVAKELSLGNQLLKVEKVISFPSEEYIEIVFAEKFKNDELSWTELDNKHVYETYVGYLQQSVVIYAGCRKLIET